MLLEIIWDDQTTPIDLDDGTILLGGGPTDDIRLSGLPHGLVTITIEGERVTVMSIRSVQIGAAPFPARVPRLLLPGEGLELPSHVTLRRVVDSSRQEARKSVETAAVVKELLGGGLRPERTRAATLTCVTGADQGVVLPVAFEVSIIGREYGADVRVRDRAVSRRHASLRRDGQRYMLSDLSATNGVYLNGVRVREQRELMTGDVIELGQTLLRFDGAERAPDELTKVGGAPVVSSSPEGRPTPASAPRQEVDEPWPIQAPNERVDEPTRAKPGRLEVALISTGALLALAGIAVTALMLGQ